MELLDRWILFGILLKKHEVHGVKRRSSSINTNRIDHLYQDPHEKIKILFCIMEIFLIQFQLKT